MHHTVAWYKSIADATESDVQPVVDDILVIQNNHFLPQHDYQMLYAAYMAATATRARIITATLRQITTPFIRPIEGTLLPGNQPNVADYRANPFMLQGLEELQVDAVQSSGGAAGVFIVAGLQMRPMTPAPQGDVYTLRGTGTTTQTAQAWSTIAVTWQDTLAAGNYVCVGCEFIGTNAVAGRLIFEDQVWRPGGLGGANGEVGTHDMFRKGGLGIWGRFNANRMPNVQMLSNAADTAQEIYLDLIRVA